MKMCMRFGYYLQIKFYYLFCVLNVITFQAQILSMRKGNGYFVYATPPTVYADLCETVQVFLSSCENVDVIWI